VNQLLFLSQLFSIAFEFAQGLPQKIAVIKKALHFHVRLFIVFAVSLISHSNAHIIIETRNSGHFRLPNSQLSWLSYGKPNLPAQTNAKTRSFSRFSLA
jgi:hypothetical protein